MKELAPIILFVYNRPSHTKEVIKGLLSNPEAKDSMLFVFADGPKQNASKENIERIKATRDYIHTISGFKDIIIDESQSNRGLANATIRGCTMVINKYGKMIVLEDDDVPSPFFLSYINRCLDKYYENDYVWCVSGYTDTTLLPPKQDGDDLFYVNRPSSWGFGTWKRCWDKVIWDIPTLKGLFSFQSIISKYNKWAGLDASGIMLGLFEGCNSSWSVRYNFAAFLNRAVTILPNKTLITNTGLDGSGTHCGIQDVHQLQTMDRDVIIPDNIKFDKIRNHLLWKTFIPQTLKGKVRYFISNHLILRRLFKK